jgi:hypothetical protein
MGTTPDHARLVRRRRLLEYLTLGWNVVGVAVLAFAAITAGSVAAAGFGLDSLIEIGASTVVLWQLADTVDPLREHRATRLIGVGFLLLVIDLVVQVAVVLAIGEPARAVPGGYRLDRGDLHGDAGARGRQDPHRDDAGQPGAPHGGRWPAR